MATAMMGMGLTVLAIVFAYIWKSNGKLQSQMVSNQERMMTALERIGKGQEGMAVQIGDGQKKLGEMLEKIAELVARIPAETARRISR